MRNLIRNLILTLLLMSFTCTLKAQIVKENDYYQRLFYLCKAWGHAKYYHSEICKGTIMWDEILFRAVNAAKVVTSNEEFNDSLLIYFNLAGESIKGTGALPSVDDSLNNISDLSWTHSPFYSAEFSSLLDTITSRISWQSNYYVFAQPGVGNTLYSRDSAYFSTTAYPSEEIRLLALFRYWNAINYFYPYLKIMDVNWDTTLQELIPDFVNADDSIEYYLSIRKLLNRINDSHSFISSSVTLLWNGVCLPPFLARQIEGEMVITKVLPDNPDIFPGDIVKEMDGFDIYGYKDSLRDFSFGSNETIVEKNLNDIIMWGDSGKYNLTLFDGTNLKQTTFERNSQNFTKFGTGNPPIWKDTVLNGGCNFGIVDMGRLETSQVPLMFSELWDTDAIIFDIRNYPNGTLWSIVNYLFSTPINIANFTIPMTYYPGRFNWTKVQIGYGTGSPYDGSIIILMDERTQSQAEYTCMGLEQFKNSIKIGSQTAAADGNVSFVYLPGQARAYFTGIGTYYPDYTQTQRIGIIPDIEIKPTIEGIREGRDEVLEYALNCSLILDVKENTATRNLNIFPNPFTNSINYSIPEDMIESSVRLEIIDILGRSRISLDDKDFTGSLDLSVLENGTYIIKFQSEIKTISKILIKY